VKTEKIYGTIIDLPFRNESFDLVTCLEVLEHLPHEEFKKGISELQRICRKYIIITVPNDSDLRSSLVMCPECYCWFNPYFHMRRFNADILQNLFSTFQPIKMKGIGPIKNYLSYNHFMLMLSWLWSIPLPPETAICPQCGYRHKKGSCNFKNNRSKPLHPLRRIVFSFKPLFRLFLPTKKKKRWLLAVYEKADR
jgi:hypothetical protein